MCLLGLMFVLMSSADNLCKQLRPTSGPTKCKMSSLIWIQTVVIYGTFISINTHYYNSNVIWRTVSLRVDEVIPSDHPETRSVKGDPMV